MNGVNVQNELSQSNTQCIKKKQIYVLGGHKLSFDYLSKIRRGFSAGLLHYENLSFIDDHEEPYSAKHNFSWIKKSYVSALADILSQTVQKGDVLVPDHTAPHVLLQLFLQMIAQDKDLAQVRVDLIPFALDLKLPFQQSNSANIVAISFAKWVCPIDCAEPPTCPAINDERNWNFNEYLNSYINKYKEELNAENHLFFCDQLVYGVCQLSLLQIKSQWQKLRQSLSSMAPSSTHRFLVATFSKCHGILGLAEAKS